MDAQVKSAARILELLELLGRAAKPVSLTNVIDELGYPKSSAHMLMGTLVARGYALRDENNRFHLNPAHRIGPGWVTGPHARLIEVATPILAMLRDHSGETVMLGVLNRDLRLRTIATCVGKQAVRYDSPLSGSIPSYCTAMGRVMLAAVSAREVDRYLASERIVAHTSHTVIDRGMLKQMIAKAGQEGYAVSDQEMDIGGSGVAAPVNDASGRVIAALNVAAVSSRFHMDRDRIIVQVREYALMLSSDLSRHG
jgi:DNA-binding IclR family transcriptional regulator